MIYYHSAILEGLKKEEAIKAMFKRKHSLLISYFALQKSKSLLEKIKYFRNNINLFMLDSGAFSAYNQKKSIDIDLYMKFIDKHKDLFSCYISLDVIGDATASVEKYKIMRKNNFNPMPVYHPPFSGIPVLQQYIDAGATSICFGAIASGLKSNRGSYAIMEQKIDNAFRTIQDQGLIEKVKVHGLGIFNRKLMLRYPWESCDSSKMTILSAWGEIFFNGDFIYVSGEKKGHLRSLNGGIPEFERTAFLEKIKALGFDLNSIITNGTYRALVSIELFDDWFNSLPKKTDFKDMKIQSTLW